MSRDNGEKALISMIAVAVATFVELAVKEALGRLIDWARARTKRD
jgi:hypothetical protein